MACSSYQVVLEVRLAVFVVSDMGVGRAVCATASVPAARRLLVVGLVGVLASLGPARPGSQTQLVQECVVAVTFVGFV